MNIENIYFILTKAFSQNILLVKCTEDFNCWALKLTAHLRLISVS